MGTPERVGAWCMWLRPERALQGGQGWEPSKLCARAARRGWTLFGRRVRAEQRGLVITPCCQGWLPPGFQLWAPGCPALTQSAAFVSCRLRARRRCRTPQSSGESPPPPPPSPAARALWAGQPRVYGWRGRAPASFRGSLPACLCARRCPSGAARHSPPPPCFAPQPGRLRGARAPRQRPGWPARPPEGGQAEGG